MSRKITPEAEEALRALYGTSDVRQILQHAARFLVSTGHAPTDIARQFASVCKSLRATGTDDASELSLYVAKLPDVLSIWLTDPQYTDAQGNPARLALHGRKRSLGALIRRVFPGADIVAVAESLIRSKSVRKQNGHYVAVARYLSFAEELAYAREHSLQSVLGLLSTVQHNLSCDSPENRLLERSATNMSVPARALPAIHRRFKRELGAMLTRMDAYLREFEVAPGSEPTTTVRLGAYAAEYPMLTPFSATLKSHARRGRRGSQRTRRTT